MPLIQVPSDFTIAAFMFCASFNLLNELCENGMHEKDYIRLSNIVSLPGRPCVNGYHQGQIT